MITKIRDVKFEISDSLPKICEKFRFAYLFQNYNKFRFASKRIQQIQIPAGQKDRRPAARHVQPLRPPERSPGDVPQGKGYNA